MSFKFSTILGFVLVILLFLLTRFYQITNIPPSMYWDEASIVYNGYSIAKTGYDEWGQFLPIHFKAFGEYKLPVFIYSVAPFTTLLGPSELAVRIPAVLFSLASLLLIYLVTYEITGKKNIGLLAAFFLTISPWFFIFSRTGYEATAGLAFYLLGLYGLLRLPKSRYYLIVATVAYILSFYSYNSFRVVIPLTVSLYIFFNLNFLREKIKTLFPAILICLLLFSLGLLPAINLLNSDGNKRLKDVGIFNLGYGKKQLVLTFTRNYFSHFSPKFLLSGDTNLRSQQKNSGQIYLVDIFLFLIGVLLILRNRDRKKLLILALLLLGPIPASLTKESPHALRSIAVVPSFLIICAIGLNYLTSKAKFRVLPVALICYLVFFGVYFRNFLINYPKQSSDSWQYGYKEIFKKYKLQFNNFDNIIISDLYSQPYIFALAYLDYDPTQLRSEIIYNTTIRKETSLVKRFNKYTFETINFDEISSGKNLIFAPPEEKLTELSPDDEIKNLDGSTAFYVYHYEK